MELTRTKVSSNATYDQQPQTSVSCQFILRIQRTETSFGGGGGGIVGKQRGNEERTAAELGLPSHGPLRVYD